MGSDIKIDPGSRGGDVPRVRLRASRSARWFALVFLGLSFLGWLRLEQTIQNWSLLSQLGVSPGPLYVALTGAFWGTIGLPAAWGLWRRASWVRLAVWPAALLYAFTYWVDRLWISSDPAGLANWPFALTITALGLAAVYWVTLPRPPIGRDGNR